MQILVIRPGALGDVLLTLPAFQALQSAFPRARIDLMGDLPIIAWLPDRSVVHAAYSFERADLTALFQPVTVTSQSLQRFLAEFDVIVSYATPPEHVFAQHLTRLITGRVLNFDARPRSNMAMHMSDYLQQPLLQLGVWPCAEPPRLRLTAVDEQKAASWWARHHLDGARVVALHPGSGSRAKNWPAERFAGLVQWLYRTCGARSLVIGGPADRQAVDDVQERLAGDEYVLAHQLSLPLVAALLVRCQAYVGNDSGLTHLAAALGVPSVAVFGPTDPDTWAPRGPSVRVVYGRAPCAPCDLEERQVCTRHTCLEAVPISAVVDALQIGLVTRGQPWCSQHGRLTSGCAP